MIHDVDYIYIFCGKFGVRSGQLEDGMFVFRGGIQGGEVVFLPCATYTNLILKLKIAHWVKVDLDYRVLWEDLYFNFDRTDIYDRKFFSYMIENFFQLDGDFLSQYTFWYIYLLVYFICFILFLFLIGVFVYWFFLFMRMFYESFLAYSMEANQGQEEYEEVQTDLRKKDEEVSHCRSTLP